VGGLSPEAEAIGIGPELTPEKDDDRAVADEQDWPMAADATLSTAESDPARRGAAWSLRDRRVQP
jgi:hypothetical protein